MEANNTHPASMFDGRNLLQLVLEGQYSIDYKPGEPVDYRPTRQRRQLCRILITTSGVCEEAAGNVLNANKWIPQKERDALAPMTAKISIHADVFNVLLQTIAATQGPAAGKRFFDRWCIGPDEWRPLAALNPIQRQRDFRYHVRKYGVVVMPNLHSIRVLLEPAEQQLRAFFAADDAARPGVSGTWPRSARPRERLPWHAFAMGEDVDLMDFALPPEAPHRELIEWGWRAYQHLLRDGRSLRDMAWRQEPERRDFADSLVIRPPVMEEVRPVINYD